MDLRHFANSPCPSLPLNDQQPSVSNANATPRSGVTVDSAPRNFPVSSASLCSRSFAIDWMLKRYPDGMLSSSPNSLGESQALTFFDSTFKHALFAALGENFIFTKDAFPLKRIGRKHPSQTCVIVHSAQNIGKKFQNFPAKKLRKSLDVPSDDANIFYRVERATMTLDESEGPEDNVVCDMKSSGKKRRLLSTLKCAAAVGGGAGTFVGFRELNDTVGESNLEWNGGNGPGQNSGLGGDWGGGGHGDGGPGGGKHGPGDFGANTDGLTPMDLNGLDQDVEEERGSLLKKEDGNDLDISSQATENRIMQLLSIPSENAGEMPKYERKDIASYNEGGQKELVESECLTEGVISEGTSQRLRRAVIAFYSDLNASLVAGRSKGSEMNHSFNLGPAQLHDSGDVTSWNHNDYEMQAAPQYLEEDVRGEGHTESWAMELLEKLRGLTLESVQPSVVGKKKLQAQKPGPARREEKVAHHGFKNEISFDEQLATSLAGVGRVEMSKSQRVSPSNDERELASRGETFACLPSESESYTETTQRLGQQQGVFDWLARLARVILTKQSGWQLQLGKEKQVEEQKLDSLVNERVASALKQVLGTDGHPLPAKQSEMEAMRRLQRETFSDMLKMRERLDKIEQSTRMQWSNGSLNPPGVSRTHLKGEVKACTAFVMLEDNSSRHSRASLEQAGMQSGLDVRFTFETPYREKDLLLTQCVAGQGCSVGDGRALGGPITLGKVLYLAHINDDVSISFVPLGAQGKDVTEIINPLQDQGLTMFSSNGAALFNHCKGSALGATVSGGSFGFSLAQYLSGWGNHISGIGPAAAESDPLCLSTLGQFLFQPSERIIFSFSGLNRYWPSPPLPSSMGLHWSEMGPLVIPKIQSLQTSKSSLTSQTSTDTSFSHAHSIGSKWGIHELECSNDTLESKGIALQSIAVASEVDLGENISVGCWAQIERGEWHQDSDKRNSQWALNLSKTSGSGIDWGVSIGGSRPDFWNTATNDEEGYPGYMGDIGESYGPQMHLEAFLKIKCSRGFTLQPGLLYVLSKHSNTPALMVRSSWAL